MLYEFELGHNSMEATKNIFYAEGEGTFNHNTVTRVFKKFYGVLQIWLVAVREYQVSSTSHSPLWFNTFTT